MMIQKVYTIPADTDIYHKLPLVEENVGSLLVLLPGNPGLTNFYKCYLNLIQEAFPHFEILCPSNAGCDPASIQSLQLYGLEDQITHKYEIIRDLIQSSNKQNYDLYFLSHSVGSYFNQRVIKYLHEDQSLSGKYRIKFVGLLFPTIRNIGQSQNGIIFSTLFNYTPFVSFAIHASRVLFKLFPESYLRKFIKTYVIQKPVLDDSVSFRNFENSVTGALNIIKNPDIVKQVLSLAKEEMRDITEENEINDWFFGRKFDPEAKIWVYFGDSDRWVNHQTRDFLVKRYYEKSNKEVIFEIAHAKEGITHSFCVDKSVEFSRITIDILKSFFNDTA
ncbi:uncharacterized protein RJT21DRAFT_44718 [Scheffersomyces amazonensis]|uniref:uncharacterized protein n=1 Tax=Scheffersomyces amazonensis TaxID=1078765 RepID=UPI00315CD623